MKIGWFLHFSDEQLSILIIILPPLQLAGGYYAIFNGKIIEFLPTIVINKCWFDQSHSCLQFNPIDICFLTIQHWLRCVLAFPYLFNSTPFGRLCFTFTVVCIHIVTAEAELDITNKTGNVEKVSNDIEVLPIWCVESAWSWSLHRLHIFKCRFKAEKKLIWILNTELKFFGHFFSYGWEFLHRLITWNITFLHSNYFIIYNDDNHKN